MIRRRWTAGGGAIRTLFLLTTLSCTCPVSAQPMDRWSQHIAEASARFDIPEAWIRRVMQAESGGRTILNGRRITSRAGAMGLMQLMPGTWHDMRAAHGLGADPYDPRDNVIAGTAYLRAMYDRFGYPGLFAAYNAGPARYANHLATGGRLPPETVTYVASVGGISPRRSAAQPKQFRKSGVLVALSTARPNDSDTSLPRPEASSLFVRLSTISNFARN